MTTPTAEIAGDLATTPIARWEANIAAIRLLKELQAQDRQASLEERAVLAKYAGFGDSAFAQGLGRYTGDPAWQRRKDALQELVTDEEHESIKRSHVNAFYTTPEIATAMWEGLKDMGAGDIPNLKVLEPSAGSGRFLAHQPPEMAASSERTAVELDNLTAGLLKAQFPEATVWNSGFQDAPVPDDHFDVAISNVPFGKYGVHDPEYLATGRRFLTRSIHNYFFAKALDKLRPGGMLAFITTHYTLDAEKAQPFREYLADQADLVGAVRLPEGAFPDTEVVADIIYLRKRVPGEAPGNRDWVEAAPHQVEGPETKGTPNTFSVNRYFLDNPDMVLGDHSDEGTMYARGSYTVKSSPGGQPVTAALRSAMQEIADSPRKLTPSIPAPSSRTPRPPSGPETAPKSALDETARAKVLKMAEIGATARRLLNVEKGRTSAEDAEQIRASLNEQYQTFVESYGELNLPANRSLAKQQPDGAMLLALEVFDRAEETWEPSSIFSRRLAGAEPERNVTNAADAMSVVINESGRLDFQRMGQLLGDSPDAVRDSLAGDGLVFRNPMGGWEPADEYLTGHVREKLEIARKVAAADPAYQTNAAALEAVVPEDVPASQIATPLGAPWIPADVVNEWVAKHLSAFPNRKGEWFRYSPETGDWSKSTKVNGYEGIMRAEWGTPGMAADDILINTLRGMPVNITKSDGDGGRVKDLEGILAAREKSRQIQESFSEWIWEDQARQERLVRLYNDTHNALRPRVFDGSHLKFPGMDPRWQSQLRPHQRDAISRVVHDGTALLAHEVGFGKTAVMVASGMERQRLGLIDKPVFVVPKATHEQFARDFCSMYPGADLLFPGDQDFGVENRETFLNRIATGDWDGVILTSEQFQKIPVSPATEAKWVQNQVNDLRAALQDVDTEEGGYSETSWQGRTQKKLSTKLLALEAKLKDLRAEMNAAADENVLHFEDLGVDQIYVDEADRYKNLPFATRMGQVKGLPQSESKRAWDMFLKTQHIQGLGQRESGSFSRNGVVFATGTPIANTIAEAWTMMRYLQLPEMRRRGLHHFDAWAKTYGEITSGMEQSPQGKYKPTQRFAKFVNLPELSQLFQNVADVRVASEVPEMVAVRPRLVDEGGDPKRTTVKAEIYPALQAYMCDLRDRAERLSQVDPEVDNMLLISSDARKASLDLRMVDPAAGPNPNGKVQLAAEKVADIYRDEEENKGTQLVFLDIGTPKRNAKVTEDTDSTPEQAADDLTGEESAYVRDLYGILKRELIARGVPESDIAFVQDYPSKAREDLFEQVNAGDVRVLVGSTETVGVGVNIQARAAALHHLDVPWRPRDIEQREGRIIRQGNAVYGPEVDEESGEIIGPGRGVKIYQYVQEGSFDEFMWQAVEVKGQAVKALMRRHTPNREMEDADGLVLSASEAKALASGNPLVLRAEELKNDINTLRLQRASHRNQRENAKGQLKRLERAIEGHRDRIPRMEGDARLAQAETGDAGWTIAGKVIEKRADAGKAIQGQLSKLRLDETTGVIGQYRGFDLSAAHTNRGHQLAVTNPATGSAYNSTYMEQLSPTGLMSRLDNVVGGIPTALEGARERLAESESSIAVYGEQARRPFDRMGELASLERELVSVQARLSEEPDTGCAPVMEPSISVPDDDWEGQAASPQPEQPESAPDPDLWGSYLQSGTLARDSAGPEYWEKEWEQAQRDREAATTGHVDIVDGGPGATSPPVWDGPESRPIDDAPETGLDPEREQREPTPFEEAQQISQRLGDTLRPDVTPADVTPEALQDLRQMLTDHEEREREAEEKEGRARETEDALMSMRSEKVAKYSPIIKWADSIWGTGQPVSATVNVYGGMGGMAPKTLLLQPPEEDAPPLLRLDRYGNLSILEGYTKGEPRYVAVTDDYILEGGGQSFKVGAGVPESPAPAGQQADQEQATPPVMPPEPDLDQALEQVAAELDARDSQRLADLGIDSDQEKVERLEQLEDRASAAGASEVAEAIRETRRQDPEIIIASEISDLQEAVAVAEGVAPESEAQGQRHEGQAEEDQTLVHLDVPEADPSAGPSTKCASITRTGKPCGHNPKSGYTWCVQHIAANWPAKPPIAQDPNSWESYEQPGPAMPREPGPEYWAALSEERQPTPTALEPLGPQPPHVMSKYEEEDAGSTITGQGYLDALAVKEFEQRGLEAEAEVEEPEPTPAQRVRERIGGEPKAEVLISAYVNADAEERAYLDSLGVGELAERQGHRVTTSDAALVENALDDGWVSDEEASAAGRVQNLAQQETPDPEMVSYSMTQAEFEERIRELCDDPDALAAFEEQVEAQAVDAKAERRYRARQQAEDPAAAAAQDVSAALRSDAGEALKQRSDQAREQREEDGGEATPRKRQWTAKELRLKAKELCPPASAIRLTRRARNSTLPKAPKPPSTAAPKSGRTARKPAFTAGMRR